MLATKTQGSLSLVAYHTSVAKPAAYDGAHVVVLSGDLDVYRAPEVRMALDDARDKPHLIIDLSGAHTVSAAVLSEFVHCYKERRRLHFEPARMVVASKHVRRIFEITELAQLWPFFESLEAACHSPGIN